MARAYLNIVKNGLSSGDNTIYTCPSGGQAIIKVVNIYNTSAGAITVSTKVLDSSASVTGVWDEASVSANTQESVLQNGEVIVLEANDILKINAGSGSVIAAIISLLQIT